MRLQLGEFCGPLVQKVAQPGKRDRLSLDPRARREVIAIVPGEDGLDDEMLEAQPALRGHASSP